MIRAPSSCARGCAGIEGKARHRQSAAARQGLIDRGCKIAVESGRVSRPVRASSRPSASIARSVRLRCSLERVLADQRQGVGGDMRGVAGDRSPGWADRRSATSSSDGHNDRQIAKPRIFGQHRQEGIDHARR